MLAPCYIEKFYEKSEPLGSLFCFIYGLGSVFEPASNLLSKFELGAQVRQSYLGACTQNDVYSALYWEIL
jgi:hypothetical protein